MKTFRNNGRGHALALFCVTIWGVTFVASKRLLLSCTPAQLMFLRFVLAYAVLWALHPRWERLVWREELYFLGMGLTGCSLYFWTENTALTLTSTANVSTLVALAPLLTAILAHFAAREREPLTARVWIGFAAAFSGVLLVVWQGAFVLQVDPLGDLLALATAVLWAVYCVLQTHALARRSSLFVTRKVMFYGIVTCLPLLARDGLPGMAPLFASWVDVLCLLFLGVLGSALCYLAWAGAERLLGPVVTSGYIYAIPFVTMLAGAVFLGEPVTVPGLLGAALIVAGVWISSGRPARREEETASP